MRLSSPAFKNNGTIPKRFTGEGEDVSPELHWTGAPERTKSLALIMDDPDAPPGTWVHWVLYDLPPGTTKLPQDLPKTATLHDGARQGACWGVDAFERVGYHGPLPPPGKTHHYSFRLYALDEKPALPDNATKKQLEAAMSGHVLAESELVGAYRR